MVAEVDWPQVILALGTAVPAIIAAVAALRVHRDVKTGNGKTVGQAVEEVHAAVIDGTTPAQAAHELRGQGPAGPRGPQGEKGERGEHG